MVVWLRRTARQANFELPRQWRPLTIVSPEVLCAPSRSTGRRNISPASRTVAATTNGGRCSSSSSCCCCCRGDISIERQLCIALKASELAQLTKALPAEQAIYCRRRRHHLIDSRPLIIVSLRLATAPAGAPRRRIGSGQQLSLKLKLVKVCRQSATGERQLQQTTTTVGRNQVSWRQPWCSTS